MTELTHSDPSAPGRTETVTRECEAICPSPAQDCHEPPRNSDSSRKNGPNAPTQNSPRSDKIVEAREDVGRDDRAHPQKSPSVAGQPPPPPSSHQTVDKPLEVASMLRDLVYADLIAFGRTQAVAKEWGAIAAEFEGVCGYKEEYTRADLVLYLGHLRKRYLLESTIRKNLKAIKVISRIQGWDFPKLPLKRIREDDIRRPKFGKEQMVSLITMGKSLFDELELAYLALGSTYGLRRAELAQLDPGKDISQDGIKIRTVHEGPSTTQLVPPEIRPYIGSLKRRYSPDYLTHIFHRMMLKAGFHVQRGFGWHSIRRALATEFILSEASSLNVIRFMRWSESSAKAEFKMLPIYAVKDQARIDEQMFRIHPFLPYWGTEEEIRKERERARKLDAMREAVALIETGELESEEMVELIEMVRRIEERLRHK